MQAVRNLKRVMKPGKGRVVVRDYAVGDLSEERFAVDGRQKKLSGNFYVRGDGTRCLYFSEVCGSEAFFKITSKKFLGTFILQTRNFILGMRIFRGDLTDISAVQRFTGVQCSEAF